MSSRWNADRVSKCFRRSSFSSDTIIARIVAIRSGSKNMCSDRHRPMPCAPRLRAVAACSGVSAFESTCKAEGGDGNSDKDLLVHASSSLSICENGAKKKTDTTRVRTYKSRVHNILFPRDIIPRLDLSLSLSFSLSLYVSLSPSLCIYLCFPASIACLALLLSLCLSLFSPVKKQIKSDTFFKLRRTLSLRASSAHFRTVWKSSSSVAERRSTVPRYTSPVLPSIVIMSCSFSSTSPSCEVHAH